MINYSIIIPHKNIPDLLQICLDSIPVRDDIEIIVVDDNRDDDIVSKSDLPGLERSDCKVIFTKEGKGAGYARNVGLDNANGKWVLFADADDYFVDDFIAKIDQYKDSDFDIVFFRVNAVDLITKVISNRTS